MLVISITLCRRLRAADRFLGDDAGLVKLAIGLSNSRRTLRR